MRKRIVAAIIVLGGLTAGIAPAVATAAPAAPVASAPATWMHG